jgi:hypothetical protein
MRKLFLILLIPVLLFAKQPSDSDFVYLFFKVGDAANGLKHGQPICYIDPANYDVLDYSKTLSYNMKRVFLCTRVKKNKFDYVKDLFADGAPKKNKVKWNKIKQDKNIPYNLEEKLLSQDTVEVIDITDEIETFIEPLTGNEEPVIDANAISTGTYTVGTSGDYANRSLFAADLTTLTGDLTGNQISNITENSNSLFNIVLSGYKFVMDGNGYTVNVAFDSDLNSIAFNGPGSATFKNNIYDRTVAAASIITGVFTVINTVTPFTLCIYNNTIINNSGAVFRQATPNTIVNMYNNISNSIAIGIVIDANDDNPNSIFESNTFYNNTYAGITINNATSTYNNNVCFNNSSRNFESIGSATGNNNASSDATAADINWSSGSNNQINLVAANEFESLVSTDANFLLPVKNGNLNGAGINPIISGHTTYYNGVSIVLGDVDIGAKGLARHADVTGPYKNPVFKNQVYRLREFLRGVFK